MKNKKGTLTIISIPFIRLKRVLLFPDFINSLSDYSDVLIVSPFKEKKILYKNNNSIFYFKLNNERSKFQNFLYNLTESLRMCGFYRRERNNGLSFWYKEQFLNISEEGVASKKAIIKRIILYLISLVGSIEKSWIFFDNLLGKFIFQEPGLLEITRNYGNISIMQSANWGFDDRKLAWISKKNNWNKILIPYTTDQLMCNGYLISNFDHICVQGPKEFDYSRKLHKVSTKKIIKFGSLLYRHIDLIFNKLNEASNNKNIILWAGVSKVYFPLESQIRIVDLICKNIENNVLLNTQLVLRPFLFDKDLANFINKYKDKPYIKFELPEITNYGLDSSLIEVDFLKEFKQYIKNMSKITLLIIPGITSMVLEASYLGIPSISIFDDPSGNLSKRNYDCFFKKNGDLVDFREFKYMKCIHDINLLIENINQTFLLRNDLSSKKIANDWDYSDSNYKEKLKNLIKKTKC